MKTLILIHSLWGHIYRMAQAVAEGAKEIEGMDVEIKRVPETLSPDIIAMMGATEAQKAMEHIPVANLEDLEEADGIIFGTGTRFGNMSAQMKAFLDSTGGLWAKGALVGKVGSVFTSSGTQHGGQESTLLTFHPVLLHHGMVIAGLPYAFGGQTTMSEISGGSPYGASTIAGGDGSRQPSQNELDGARFQGKYVAGIVKKLAQ
ncbi:MAG TPA: NAD(P)H:quinone oxidoreductase [Candidatus Cloacimonadota bacterium]|nr:NAD(P)H:quinone oxidoreductase [Candidatus Cloacimonadota bacterium]HPN40624.1 NAD(P)H:quinone oxidoreductase [Candidatus Cloacimonadota bacterium]